jgi:hypothetical protein
VYCYSNLYQHELLTTDLEQEELPEMRRYDTFKDLFSMALYEGVRDTDHEIAV